MSCQCPEDETERLSVGGYCGNHRFDQGGNSGVVEKEQLRKIKSFVADIYTQEAVLLKQLPVTAGLFAKKFKLNEEEKLSFMKALQEVCGEVTLLDLVGLASFEARFSEWEEMKAFLEE